MNILVTGGCGFIGSALIQWIIHHTNHQIINIDKLTYAANLQILEPLEAHSRYTFYQGDIGDGTLIEHILHTHDVDAVFNLAAESHVDTSIFHSEAFIQTNIVGTYQLLQGCLGYWYQLGTLRKDTFRFIHISTDEVFGDLTNHAPAFDEHSLYKPSSPYSASKASSDHLVKAWHRTYGLPTIITHCSNNYGEHQHPEKLIPKMIQRAIATQSLPIYGTGQQIRDWLYVGDHINALLTILTQGKVGETYCIGGSCERSNLQVVHTICSLLDNIKPENAPHHRLIAHATDRQGHDHRYAINSRKIQALGWQPTHNFEQDLEQLILTALSLKQQ
ncbi:dTDP-glucose 4,6-dehydratase [Vibrio splendidus]